MRSSPQTIEIYFKEVLVIAEQLRCLSMEMERIGQETIPKIICDTKRGWGSEAAQKLVAGELEVGNEYCEMARNLGVLAAEIKEQVKEMYRMEMCNLELASTRVY